MQKGLITISKTSTRNEDDFVSIRVVSDWGVQGKVGIQVKMSVADFAEAVFGKAFCPCEFQRRDPAKATDKE